MLSSSELMMSKYLSRSALDFLFVRSFVRAFAYNFHANPGNAKYHFSFMIMTLRQVFILRRIFIMLMTFFHIHISIYIYTGTHWRLHLHKKSSTISYAILSLSFYFWTSMSLAECAPFVWTSFDTLPKSLRSFTPNHIWWIHFFCFVWFCFPF